MKSDRAYFVAVSAAPGIGPARFQLLLDHFGKAQTVWELPEKDVRKILGEKLSEPFIHYRSNTDPTNLITKITETGVKITTLEDKDYPYRLKTVDQPPPVLFWKGDYLPIDQKAIAVVGSRKATSYGKEVTESLVTALVGEGFTIVSGLARGVDSLAHKAALACGSRTIAVLGGGLGNIYPSENEKLATQISEQGAVLSEYLPQQPSVPGNFPARNRIISGLSLGVVVTEATEDSGSLITAGFAAEQGREVFAVPGPIYSKLAAGPASLIKQGAKLVMGIDDILEELKLERSLGLKVKQAKGDSPEEQEVVDLLQDGAVHVDDLSRKLKLPIQKVSTTLSMLELKGLVKALGGGSYTLKR